MDSFVGMDPWQAHPPDEFRALAKTPLTLDLHQEDGAMDQAVHSSVVFCHSILLDLWLCQRIMEQLLCAEPFQCPWNEKDNSPASVMSEESDRDRLEGVRSTEEWAEEAAGGKGWGCRDGRKGQIQVEVPIVSTQWQSPVWTAEGSKSPVAWKLAFKCWHRAGD